MTKPFKAHDVAAIERALKRRLRPSEIASGKIAATDETPFDAEIIEAEKRLADKKIAAMPQAERDLHFAKQSRDQYLGKQADAKALAERQKKVAPRVAELKKLQADAANDPAFNAFDRTAIEKCLSFYEVGSSQPSLNDYAHPAIGEEQVAEALYAGVVEIVKAKNAMKTESLQTKRAELERQRISIDAELSALTGKPAQPGKVVWSQEGEDSAWKKYNDVKGQLGSDSQETKDALESWGQYRDVSPENQSATT